MMAPVFVEASEGWSVFRALGYLSPISVASQNPHFHKTLLFIYWGVGGICLYWMKLQFSQMPERRVFDVLYLMFGTLFGAFCIMTALALLIKGSVVYSPRSHGKIISKPNSQSED